MRSEKSHGSFGAGIEHSFVESLMHGVSSDISGGDGMQEFLH